MNCVPSGFRVNPNWPFNVIHVPSCSSQTHVLNSNAFAQACASASDKVLQNTAQYLQYLQLGSQIEALKADNADISSQVESLNINPAEISFANFIAGSYKLAQQSVVQAIYQLNQVGLKGSSGSATTCLCTSAS